MAREKLAWAEAQASASLAQKEQEWEARIDTATSGAHQEASCGFGGVFFQGGDCFRPFLIQSSLSVENGLSQIGLFYTVEKGLFRLNFFPLRISTGGSSRKTQSKKFYTCFLNRSHRSSHHQTHPHGHTATHL